MAKIAPIVQKAYEVFEGTSFPECDGCSLCCSCPWLLKEESAAHPEIFKATTKTIEDVDFLWDDGVCKYVKDDRCSVYPNRPLDCRIFPLDVLEVDGVFWWAIYTTCPQHKIIRKRLLPLAAKLEKVITSKMWEQYLEETRVIKTAYPACKSGEFELLRKFNVPK
jgi:hypothetical protein